MGGWVGGWEWVGARGGAQEKKLCRKKEMRRAAEATPSFLSFPPEDFFSFLSSSFFRRRCRVSLHVPASRRCAYVLPCRAARPQKTKEEETERLRMDLPSHPCTSLSPLYPARPRARAPAPPRPRAPPTQNGILAPGGIEPRLSARVCVCVCVFRARPGRRARCWRPPGLGPPERRPSPPLTHPTHSSASPRPPAGCVGMEVAGLPGTVPFLFSFSSLFFFFLHFSACMGACAKRSVRDGDARAWRAPGSGVRARV